MSSSPFSSASSGEWKRGVSGLWATSASSSSLSPCCWRACANVFASAHVSRKLPPFGVGHAGGEAHLEEPVHVERRPPQVDAQPVALARKEAVLGPRRDPDWARPPFPEREADAARVGDDRLAVPANHLHVRVAADQH